MNNLDVWLTLEYKPDVKLASILLLISCFNAFGHGEVSSSKEKPSATKIIYRSLPTGPTLLSHEELLKTLKEKESPPDVAIVECKLNQFAVCRGMRVALLDESGKEILVANSGSEGVFGLQGLRPGQKYRAVIQNNRFKGDAEIRPGAYSVITAN